MSGNAGKWVNSTTWIQHPVTVTVTVNGYTSSGPGTSFIYQVVNYTGDSVTFQVGAADPELLPSEEHLENWRLLR